MPRRSTSTAAAPPRSSSPTASQRRATTSCCWPPAAAPRRLPVPGADLDGVHYLRTRSTTATGCKAACPARRPRGGRRRRLDRPGGRGRRPRPPACEVTVLEPADLPLLRVLGPESAPGASPTCTASTASTCGCGVELAEIIGERRARPTASGSPTAAPDRGRHRRRRRRRQPEHRAGRGRRAGGRQRRRASTPRLRTSDPDIFAAGDVASACPPASRAAHPGRALGQRAEPAARPPRRRCSARTARLRPAAVLLHRPVRPRHGVRRPRRPGRLRPGRVPRRRRRAGVHRVLARARAACSPG